MIYPQNPHLRRIEARYEVRPVALLAWYAQRQLTSMLCWERSGHCHRHVLQQLVEQTTLTWDDDLAMLCLGVPVQNARLFHLDMGGQHG